jgi:hypothetical protein
LPRRPKFSEGLGKQERNLDYEKSKDTVHNNSVYTRLLHVVAYGAGARGTHPAEPNRIESLCSYRRRHHRAGHDEYAPSYGRNPRAYEVVFSDTGVPSVGIWANLVRVRGTSSVTGITYLGVGAQNVSWVGLNPGPPNIPQQQLSFTLVSLEISPGPPQLPPNPILPVFLRNFVFGAENTNQGELQTVEAGFSQ